MLRLFADLYFQSLILRKAANAIHQEAQPLLCNLLIDLIFFPTLIRTDILRYFVALTFNLTAVSGSIMVLTSCTSWLTLGPTSPAPTRMTMLFGPRDVVTFPGLATFLFLLDSFFFFPLLFGILKKVVGTMKKLKRCVGCRYEAQESLLKINLFLFNHNRCEVNFQVEYHQDFLQSLTERHRIEYCEICPPIGSESQKFCYQTQIKNRNLKGVRINQVRIQMIRTWTNHRAALQKKIQFSKLTSMI